MTQSEDEGFLARWSRRKRATAAGQPVLAEPGAAAEPQDAGGEPPDLAAECDAADTADTAARDGGGGGNKKLLKRMLTEADFADVDFKALDFKSDYTRFMQQGVPDQVRNKALRQLWASDPIMANMDGLHDYWDDYTDAAVAVPAGTLKTAYRIGKGFLSDDEVAQWEALGKPEAAPETAVAGAPAAVAAEGEERNATAEQADAAPLATGQTEDAVAADVQTADAAGESDRPPPHGTGDTAAVDPASARPASPSSVT